MRRNRRAPERRSVPATTGGAETAQQYLRARLVDELGIHVSPLLLGSGSRLFDHLGGGPAGFELVSVVSSHAAAHFAYVRGGGA